MRIVDPRDGGTTHIRTIRFGQYEADMQALELRKAGVRIHLQAQPFKVLALLLERPNEIVSRDDIRWRLWEDGTTVDFEHGLSSAVKKIREALNDSASNPRFVETLARRGYRFIAPVMVSPPHLAEEVPAPPQLAVSEVESRDGHTASSAAQEELQSAAPASLEKDAVLPRRSPWPQQYIFFFVFVMLLAALGWQHFSTWPPLGRLSQVTFSGRANVECPYCDSLPHVVTDGSRIYFAAAERGQSKIAVTSIGDGKTTMLAIPSDIQMPVPLDISPDLSRLLVRDRLGLDAEQPLWIVPVSGGVEQRVSNIQTHDAVWEPDGSRIVYASGNSLFTAREDGADIRLLKELPGRPFWLRWSGGGDRLRFTLSNSHNHQDSIWEMDKDGSHAHPLLPNWKKDASLCCGSWTADGRYFVFTVTEDGHSDIWMRDESLPPMLRWLLPPRKLTNGPLNFQESLPAKNDDTVYIKGVERASTQVRFDPEARQIDLYSPSTDAVSRTEFSRDGQWVAWIDSRKDILWRSRADGTHQLQLTSPPVQVWMMKWSPDNRRLAYVAREPGKRWKIYVIDAMGGPSVIPLTESLDETDVDWSPDGQTLLFGRLPGMLQEEKTLMAIYTFQLQTKQLSTVPGSSHMSSPRWSPDGRYIATLFSNGNELMIFDTATQRWRELLSMPVSDPVWSHDGNWIFFLALNAGGRAIYKVNVVDGQLKRITGIEAFQQEDVGEFYFSSLAPGDKPLIRLNTSIVDFYSIELKKQ